MKLEQNSPSQRNENVSIAAVAGKKMVAAVSQAVSEAKAKKKLQIEGHTRTPEENRSYELVQWLRQSEMPNGSAWPLMHFIREAQQVHGHKLCIGISKDLVLSSKGFRLTALKAPAKIGGPGAIGTNVKRVTECRINHRISPDFYHEKIKRDVNSVLESNDLTPRLLWLGVDEWPKSGRVAFAAMSAATFTVSAAMFAISNYFMHRLDYEQALKPVLA